MLNTILQRRTNPTFRMLNEMMKFHVRSAAKTVIIDGTRGVKK